MGFASVMEFRVILGALTHKDTYFKANDFLLLQ